MTGPGVLQPLGETLTQRQKMLVVGALMISMFVGAIDQTVVSTAMPRIVAELGGFGLLSWVFTSYMLSSTVVVPLVGKLSDTFGRKWFILGGIAVFQIGSLACGAAPNIESLIAFRALQGIGGGAIMASVFATIGDLFPPAERGKYMGMFTGTFSLASILGPTVGGLITDNYGWRWVFYVNIPIGLIAIPAVWFNLPGRRLPGKAKIDWLGAFLLSSASVLFLLALVWAGDKYAWSSKEIVGLIAASVLLLAAFIFQEIRHESPMVPLHLFRNRVFLMSNLTVFMIGMGMFGSIAYLPTFVQTALGASATASGVVTTPQSLGLLVASVVGGQVISRTGRYRWQTILGAALFLIAMGLLTTLEVGMPRWHVSAFMVFLGAGIGLVMPTQSLVIQNAVPYQYLGVSSSAGQFFRQIGGVFGTAIFGTILANSYHASFDDHVPAAVQQAMPAPILERFDDPTLQLDPRTFAVVRQQVLALPNGEATFAAAAEGQKLAVADAVTHIFVFSTVVAGVCLLVTFFIPELPLRRQIGAGGPPSAAGPPGPQGPFEG
ncbi:MAG: MFS transporter [Dehalococcoidia bacterium]|nr:MFS transporter [Dehalococcoidia bacterium]RIL04176.1 MAG: MFS transporter [bacterium]